MGVWGPIPNLYRVNTSIWIAALIYKIVIFNFDRKFVGSTTLNPPESIIKLSEIKTDLFGYQM